MTQIPLTNLPTAAQRLAERLHAVGQKLRVYQLLRGLLWLAILAVVATTLAVGTAHFVGPGPVALVTLVAWIIALAAAAWWCMVRPILRRPAPTDVARLVESRIDGLHSGLTNALQLKNRQDLSSNPWLPEIFEEILRTAQTRPLTAAVRLTELRPLLVRTLLLILASTIAATAFGGAASHGWRQLLRPMAFVPAVGSARIVSVQPGDATMTFGGSMEFVIVGAVPGSNELAKGLNQPVLKVFFEAAPGEPSSDALLPRNVEVLPASATAVAGDPADRQWRYVLRLDRLERSFRYRVELAGTQSRWFDVNVIRDVRLQSLALTISPPAYLRQPPATIRMSPAQIGTTPISAPEGSTMAVSAEMDSPVEGAILLTGNPTASGSTASYAVTDPPPAMTRSESGRQLSASFTLVRDTPVTVLLTSASGQAFAKVPPQPLLISAVRDTPPSVDMRWPRQDAVVPLDAALRIDSTVGDDHGLSAARIMVSVEPPTTAGQPSRDADAANAPLVPAAVYTFADRQKLGALSKVLALPAAARTHGSVVRVQVEAVDDRDLGPAAVAALSRTHGAGELTSVTGRQTTRSAVYRITFQDPARAATTSVAGQADALRARLTEFLAAQKALQTRTLAAAPAQTSGAAAFTSIAREQATLRDLMRQTAETFEFPPHQRVVQKSLQMLVIGPAAEAADIAAMVLREPIAAERLKLSTELQSRQRRIIDVLESLLLGLGQSPASATRPSSPRGDDLAGRAEELRALDEALKSYVRQQQKLLDQATSLAKKPVDRFTDADQKLLAEIAAAQEKLDAFMQEKVRNVSKLAEQDMANASQLREMMEVHAEVTMARDALKQKAIEIAVAAEDNGIDLAKEITSNIEKWLSNRPDRIKWTQEDPPFKSDVPLAELPKELEDLIGELLEREEDLFDEIEDQNANWHSSTNITGWDAVDGPISNMTAKGVTGNQLPNNNEMTGRSGEGRTGRSHGEFVEETATGKGGRRTPTRLDPTPFQKGQVKDVGKDPTGGATGGGKISGQGAAGLEGPVPPQSGLQAQRLADLQAQIRNAAERLNLQFQLGRYDNFRLLESIALMRRVEADLSANRYETALRRRDVLLDRLETSRLITGAQVHVRQDTTPTGQHKERKEIGDAMKGEMPAAWKEAIRAYYERLAREQ
ncbi:hypothetical protein [Humisphaera borealis]|uniref:DUF4175 family protein n=1 Tax=Humisphaera borealis TaxID=2807512 RepID=A0A7M2WZK1_9BACT|nr:hypothetical protein [Humisphaera borealis]QOV90928.1 hypothetical protein IPV69_06085 [Humisphaera borealis]